MLTVVLQSYKGIKLRKGKTWDLETGDSMWREAEGILGMNVRGKPLGDS